MDKKQAEKAVEDIIKDLSDRRGLKSEWCQIDDDIQEEIKSIWVSIILEAAKKL